MSARACPQRVMLTSDAIGGVWRYTLELTRYLRSREIDVAIVTVGPAPTPEQLEEAVAAGAVLVEITSFPLDWTARSEDELAEATTELKRQALLWDADVIHLHAPAYAGRRPWTRPLVVSVHSCLKTWWAAAGQGTMPSDFQWRSAATARGLAIADCIIAPSKSFAEDLSRLYGRSAQITAIRNSRPPRPCGPRRSGPGRVMLTAGRLWDRGKNIRILDEAVRITGLKIYAAGPIRGPGGEAVELRHLQLLGELGERDMSVWHARAGVFISPSRYEPFGLAVLEAAQARTALVLSDIPTFRELWDGAALFFNPDDAGALAEALKRVANTRSDREALASAALMRSREYSADSMGRETLDLYRAVLFRSHSSKLAAAGESA